MNEIKLRRWNPEKREFEYLILSPHTIVTTLPIPSESKWDKLGPWELYTGLKDKNEKEIFEGDIVRYYHRSFNWDGVIGFEPPLYFAKGINGDVGYETLMGCEEPCEVIGNIHEVNN